uniref:Uncharacterized protein n=1 Tax=Candidatus Kentrum sp. DK TaxID=2126562 RepID=A0A450T5X1_9GAMM|nr:MAG: hypothetical protein BECKDK2373B_GA0170837_110713 [Candidatus Kentron sp. DK]
MISVGKDYAALSGLVGYPSLFPQGVALGCIDCAPLGLMFACPLDVSEKQSFRILAWCIRKDRRWERRSPGRLFCPKGIMFILFAPTGQDPYSQGQRPWIGLGVGSALKGRNTVIPNMISVGKDYAALYRARWISVFISPGRCPGLYRLCPVGADVCLPP